MRKLSPSVPYGISTVSRAIVGVEAPELVAVYRDTQETVRLLGYATTSMGFGKFESCGEDEMRERRSKRRRRWPRREVVVRLDVGETMLRNCV